MSNLYCLYHLREIPLVSRILDIREGSDVAERIQVPIPNLQDGGFLRQSVRQVLELDGPAGDPDGELLVEELGGDEQVALAGPGPELHHVLEADPGLLQAAPPVRLVEQALGVGLAQLLGRHGPTKTERRRDAAAAEAGGTGRGETDIERGIKNEAPREKDSTSEAFIGGRKKWVGAEQGDGWKWRGKARAFSVSEKLTMLCGFPLLLCFFEIGRAHV